MAVTLNANTSTGFIATSDTSGVLQLQTGGTTAVTVDASQNVGIGTVSPTDRLDIRFASGTGNLKAGVTAGNNIKIYNSAGDLSITTSDSASDAILDSQRSVIFKTANTERMRIDSSGNVGIGTSSPATKLDVSGPASVTSFTGTTKLGVTTRGSTGATDYSGIDFIGGNQTNPVARIAALTTGGGSTLSFGTSNNYANGITNTAMTIDTSGNLLVGTTTSVAPLTIGKAASQAANGQLCIISPTAGDSNISGMSIIKYANDSSTSQVLMRFLMNQGGTGQGQINANGANTAAFGSYSDSRLKENIVDLPSQLDNIMALRPVEYDYIESMGGGHQIGFVAQEVQAIYPDLVGETEDGMLTLTDMNKNDARLIKAIQEMKAIIDTQANTITQLQADVAALKGASA